MKTIEERVEELAESLAGFSLRKSVIKERLSQFAADLNAEKEKELEQAASNWQETALHFSNGLEFYRGVVRQIGKMFGEAAKTSDDVSAQKDALALKVPELVDELIAKAAEKEKEVAELRRELAMATDAANKGDKARLKAGAMEDMIADQTALLDEVKRVLGLINYGEHDNPNDEGNGPCLCSQCQFVRAKRQLLTRLGSHE